MALKMLKNSFKQGVFLLDYFLVPGIRIDFLVTSEVVEFQFVNAHQIPDFRNIKGRKPRATAYQNRLSCFA